MELTILKPAPVVAVVELPAPRNPRYLTLDHWRGLACLMIVVVHASHHAKEDNVDVSSIEKVLLAILWRFGIAVPMFFVISGYCIAATCDSTRRKTQGPWLFFYRRFRRIFPPYWIVTLLSLVLVVALTTFGQGSLISEEYGFIPHPATLTASQWLGNVTLTEEWRSHLFGGPILKIVGPAWTLCYEEQFYFVCGLLLVLCPRHFFLGTAAITVLTLFLCPLGLMRPDLCSIQGLFFDGHWLMFMEGVAVYYILNYVRSFRVALSVFAGVLAITFALSLRKFAPDASPLAQVLPWELMGSTLFSIVLLLLHPWDKRWAGSRLLQPLSICGQMCYSLYLVHWPVSVIMTTAFHRSGVQGLWPTLLIVTPLTVACSLIAAWFFHVVVERRFLNSPIVVQQTTTHSHPICQ